jgi:hypothetical protein
MAYSYTALYQDLLRTSFSYLENTYKYFFSFSDFSYTKNNIKIYITFEFDFIKIKYWLVSEPRFTTLPISVFLEMNHEISYPVVADRASVKDTIEIYSMFYEKRIDYIAQNLPGLLLPALKWAFSKALQVSGLTLKELLGVDDFQELYNYIIERNNNWEP